MEFRLTVNMDNAAFESRPAAEIARILREVAKGITTGDASIADGGKVRDINGNTVGTFEVIHG